MILVIQLLNNTFVQSFERSCRVLRVGFTPAFVEVNVFFAKRIEAERRRNHALVSPVIDKKERLGGEVRRTGTKRRKRLRVVATGPNPQ